MCICVWYINRSMFTCVCICISPWKRGQCEMLSPIALYLTFGDSHCGGTSENCPPHLPRFMYLDIWCPIRVPDLKVMKLLECRAWLEKESHGGMGWVRLYSLVPLLDHFSGFLCNKMGSVSFLLLPSASVPSSLSLWTLPLQP